MSAGDVFFDTNVLLYLLAADAAKADCAEALIAGGGTVSVQVLNEFAAVALRKLAMGVREIREVLGVVRAVCLIAPLSVATHERALDLVARVSLSFYDALIVAAAQEAQCGILYSEDMQDGRTIGDVTIRNPFRGG